MAEQKKYDNEYKIQAVKLAKEIGTTKASSELGIPKGTLYGWLCSANKGNIDLGVGEQTPESGLTLAAEIQKLRAEMKKKDKEIARLKEENEFLAEASAFFAASHRRSGKKNV